MIKAILLCAAMLTYGVAVASDSELSADEIELVDDLDTALEYIYESRLEGSKFLLAKNFNLLLNFPRATQESLDHAFRLAQHERYQMKARKKAISLAILEDLSKDERAALHSFFSINYELNQKIVQNSSDRLHKSAEANITYFFDVLLGALGTPEERVYFQFIEPCKSLYEVKLVSNAPIFDGEKTIACQSCASGFPASCSNFRFLLNSREKNFSLAFNNGGAYFVKLQENQAIQMTADPLQDAQAVQIKATLENLGAAPDYRTINITNATTETTFRLMAASMGRKVKYVGVEPSQLRATYSFDAFPLRNLGSLLIDVAGQVGCRVGADELVVYKKTDRRAQDRKNCYLP